MNVVIFDTGCANLSSLYYAVKRLGYQPIISCDAQAVLQADKLFLPGVGTAQAAMKTLQQRKRVELIKDYTQPVLGICLGMQLLASSSEENGGINTLGIINTSVQYIANIAIADFGLPLPHMGWNQLSARTENDLFRGIDENSHFYFVHSFAMPVCKQTIAQTVYGGPFTAAVQKDNFFGVQFHPERSGAAGARLLRNFLEM